MTGTYHTITLVFDDPFMPVLNLFKKYILEDVNITKKGDTSDRGKVSKAVRRLIQKYVHDEQLKRTKLPQSKETVTETEPEVQEEADGTE